MAVRIGRWDCDTCGQTGILGPETKCTSCGAPRPDNVQFYLPEDAEEVTDEKKIEEAHAGADWVCAHCSSHNKAWETSCQSCGNPKAVKEDGDKDLEEKVEYFNQPKKAASQPKKGQSKLVKFFLRGFAAIVIFLVGFFVLASFDKEIEVTVKEHGWERTIQMEEYKEVVEEDWKLPANASVISSERAIHHYDKNLIGHETRTRDVQVKVGEEKYKCGQVDKGNGYFVDKYCTKPIYETRTETYEEPIYEKVPVYQTKYKYSVMKWLEINPLVAQGKTKNEAWPKPSSAQEGNRFREGEKKERYYFVLKVPDNKDEIEDVSYEFWKKVPEKGRLKATKSFVFGFYKGLKEGQGE